MFKVYRYVVEHEYFSAKEDAIAFQAGMSTETSKDWTLASKDFDNREDAVKFASQQRDRANAWFSSFGSYESPYETEDAQVLSGNYEYIYYPIVDTERKIVDLSIMTDQDPMATHDTSGSEFDYDFAMIEESIGKQIDEIEGCEHVIYYNLSTDIDYNFELFKVMASFETNNDERILDQLAQLEELYSRSALYDFGTNNTPDLIKAIGEKYNVDLSYLADYIRENESSAACRYVDVLTESLYYSYEEWHDAL